MSSKPIGNLQLQRARIENSVLFTNCRLWCAICTDKIRLTTTTTTTTTTKKTKMDQNQQKSTFFLQRLAIAVRYSVSNNRTDRKISEICAIFVSNKVAQGGKNTQKE